MTRKMKTYLDTTVTAVCISLLTVQPVLAQSIVSDGAGPVVIETANGTTMVMISTPDANGVSHNTFVEFGVGADGAILNNVDTNTGETQLGGIVQGNGNLAGGAASIIINEVTTSNPSLLNGYLEVGGQRADVIVANPYGITCDGCGFINTDRLTMTTGTPTFDGGSFTGLSVDGGAVNIGAGGLDASDTTRFDLISRQISVAGAVQGQRIRVIAGRNDVIYATGEITEKADDGSATPTLAIDSTVMGGMFAGAITITSTEDGVGVRAPQNMAASAGGMMITADGRLVMRDASATQNVTVESTADVVIEGTVVAQQDVEITTPEDLIMEANAVLVADSAAMLNAGNLTLGANAELAAGTQISATIDGALTTGAGSDLISDGSATITADTVTNNGTMAATGGALMLTTTGNLVNTGLAFGDTSVVLRSDADIFNNGGSIVANGDVTIRGNNDAVATAFTNQYGGLVETISGDILISAVSINNLREAPIVDSGLQQVDGAAAAQECSGDTCFDPITVAGQITVVGEAAQIISAGNITLTGTDIVNAYSLISATGNIDINADTLENIGLNVYRDTGGGAEFVGAVFGTIEARGNINGTGVTGYVTNGAFGGNAAITNGSANPDLSDAATDVINNSDLLVESVDPDSEFLVETRPEFVDLDQFISSDYFLEAIEYNPELRRFGDAYAEALYIRKQLQALLGQLIVTGDVDERAQIQAMYDNAIDAQANLDLTPGVALTPGQIGALTSDIVWLEPTVVNGETVLAPKVYLANPEIRLAALGGAMITGRNVTFTTGDFDNAGVIRASESVSIIAEDTFRSISGSVSAENIVISADTIEITTDARRVVTAQGGALVRLPMFKSLGYTDSEDVALRTSTFAAGSTIVLTARDTITTTGARIAAGDNITLVAGGDITIGALALASETGRTSGSNRNRIERFDHLTTTLTAGGDITILSSGNVPGQNDIVLEGANITAGGNVGLIAQDGDLILAAVADVYYRDYARKSGNFFRKKVRRSQTLNVTNQTAQITGASITGVAANNILVEGGRFEIPGVANSDLAPGQLSLVSVNGNSAFTAPTDVRASSSYKSTAYLGGLISNSRDKRSLITDSVGTVANTAGDIALNAGADLTLTSVDFTSGGEFVTQVTGTTYLLAAIDVEYHALVEHKDNGVIMTDIRSEDLTETVAFNGIEAAGGVFFDENSQVVLAGVRNPLIDSIQAGGWTADREDTGRMRLAGVYLGDPEEEQSEPERRDGEWISSGEDEEEDNKHWREGGEWSEEGEFLVTQVALPTGADGTQYTYIDGVLGRDSTINEPIELVNYSFYEKEQAISPAFKALLTIAVTQGLGSIGALQIAADLGMTVNTVNAAGQTVTTLSALGQGVNAAVAGFSGTFIVESTAGVVSGNFDLSDIVGQASFSAISAGLTTGIDIETFGGSFEGVGWANDSLFEVAGFGSHLTVAGLVDAGIDATLTAGLSTAVYETDFLDSFKGSVASATVNLAMADLQEGIGDLKLGEGSIEHAALHGVVGCAAATALDGNCASGAAAGIAQSIYAGLQEGEPNRNDFTSDDAYLASHQMWRNDIAAQTNLLGAAVGYATSSGEAVNVTNAASIAKSGALNNYLSHTNLASLRRDLESCDAKEGGCTLAELEDILLYYQGVSIANDSALGECQTVECVAWHMDQVADFDDLREVTAELAPDVGRDLALDYLRPDLSTERNYLANIAAQTLEDNWKTANCGTLTSVECNVGFEAHLEMLHEQNSRGAATLVLAGAGLAGGTRALAACLINPACRAALTATGSVDCAVNPNPLCLAPGPSSTPSAPNSGVRVGDSYVPSGSSIVKDGTVQLNQNVVTRTGEIIPAGSVVTETGGAIKVVTPDGVTVTGRTDNLLGSNQLALSAPNNVGGTNIRAVDSSVANAGDRLPPYNPNSPIRDFDADGTTTYVRVYTEGQTGQQGSWMMKPSDIGGLSPQQIQDRFDLPYTPTHVTDVTPPAGTPIRTGTVNEGNFGGNGGGTQFELIGDDYIPSGSFTNPRPLQ